ncbi:MAG: AAA family ATPase [Bacteroidota bacterium]
MPKASEILRNKLPFEPTAGQNSAFVAIDWLIKDEGESKVLLVKGYAGTGKTTLTSVLVSVLPSFNFKYVLLAPTGRAAKVLSAYSKRMAFTIHKRIYKQVNTSGGGFYFKLQKNYAQDTIFIVDEASMINDNAGFGNNGLLKDLMDYVFHNQSNRLILIGDNAQLPPVGQNISPALNLVKLQNDFSVEARAVALTEVRRQTAESGILSNATALRNYMGAEKPNIRFHTQPFNDIFKMTAERMEDGIRYAYDNYGISDSIVITRSNKAANLYNQYIRHQIHFYESELEAGEFLMVVKNNYLYTPDDKSGSFLANGDFVQVLKIFNPEEIHGLRFATLQLKMVDYPELESFDAKVILDTLHSEGPALSAEASDQLYESVKADYTHLSSPKEQKEAIKKDPYLNALQVKFAYAITCHKSQGGQWAVVFLDQGFVQDDKIDDDYLRWLYTAVTRATRQLFLVNFDNKFFVSPT